MRILLIILLFPFVSSCQKMFVRKQTSNLNVYGRDVYFMTNSIGLGAFASVNYPEIFCTARGATKHNNGISGQTMVNTCGFVVFDKTTIPSYTEGSVLLFELGLNDIGFNNGTTATQFETKYNDVLTYATVTKGWPGARIVMLTAHKPIDFTAYGTDPTCNPSYSDDTREQAFNAKIVSLATTYGCKLIDIYTASSTWISGDFYSDKLHLSNSGQTKLANYLISNL